MKGITRADKELEYALEASANLRIHLDPLLVPVLDGLCRHIDAARRALEADDGSHP
jgi:hypothetical protein